MKKKVKLIAERGKKKRRKRRRTKTLGLKKENGKDIEVLTTFSPEVILNTFLGVVVWVISSVILAAFILSVSVSDSIIRGMIQYWLPAYRKSPPNIDSYHQTLQTLVTIIY